MATTPEQIDLWRQSTSEDPRLEFKEAKTQYDNRKLYEYCVAMANEGGGFLLTNESLRERFHLPENKRAIASQIIAVTIEAGLIKADEKVGSSRKYARYLPFWA